MSDWLDLTNKCRTIAAAQARYGYIDFAGGGWPLASRWIQSLVLPKNLLPAFKVMNLQLPVEHIACNEDISGPLLAAFEAVAAAGLANELVTFDGCFNIRMVRGSNVAPSAHSYGLAIDLNAALNPLGSESGGFYDLPDLVKCFTDQGFDWGGNFKTRKDPMHFSWCWE